MREILSVVAVIAFFLLAALISWLSLWIIGDRAEGDFERRSLGRRR